MLFQFLKLFGLDVPAKIDAATSGVESSLERATEHVKQEIQEAVVVAALFASAAVAGATAIGVGLLALYRWIAESSGVYAGLGVEVVILSVVSVVLAAAAMIRRRAVAPTRIKLPRCSIGATGWPPDPGVVVDSSAVDAGASESDSAKDPHTEPFRAIPPAPTASASDLVEPLAFFLSKIPTPSSFGNSIVDELIGSLRTTGHGTADEAIDRSANVIRHGARADLVIVLAGAALIGWLLTRHSQQK
jgi:hypothetical protein